MNLSVLKLTSTDKGMSVWRRWILALSLVGMVGVVGWRLWQINATQLDVGNTEIGLSEITTVTALGRIEPVGELVNIAAPTSAQESRIGELRVEIGDRVQSGQIIATLDNQPRLQAALRQAEQQVNIARAQQAQIEAGAKSGEVQAQLAEISRLEAEQLGNVESQRATIARIAAEVDNAQADYARYDSLFQRGALSASERDARRLTLTTTEQRLAEAEATLSRIQTTTQQQISQAQATLNRIEDVRPVDVATAQAEVAAAVAAVEEAQASLEQAFIKAPTSGQIIDIHTRPGETVGSEGIVTLGETEEMLVIAEVYQADIANIRLGQTATIYTPILSEDLSGSVASIGLQVAPQQVVNEDPAANIDAKIIEVTIRLNDDASARVSQLSNLQVTATFESN